MPNKDYCVAIALTKQMASSILDQDVLDLLSSFAEVNSVDQLPDEITPDVLKAMVKDADACITCWGTPGFTDEILEASPKLKLIAHAAGSIKHMIPASFWGTGRRITSNAAIIAEDVSHTVLTFMMIHSRGIWQFGKSTREGNWNGGEAGLFATRRLEGLTVGIVGASHVGKSLIKLLKPFGCKLNLYDPVVPAIEAAALGVNQMELNELIVSSDVLTLHAPAIESCRHLINKDNLKLLKDGALFINTARGMVVDEAALIEELKTGRFFACIDVTDPEPPRVDHPFRTMDNVILVPHIAGGHTVDIRKSLGQCAAMEIYNYRHRGSLTNEVRFEMLSHMA